MALIICPECGKEYSNRASSCPNCGCPTTLNSAVQSNETGMEEASTQSAETFECQEEKDSFNESLSVKMRKGKRKIVIVLSICAVAVVLIVCGIVFLFGNSSPEKRIIGTWVLNSVGGDKTASEPAGILFYDDGSFSFNVAGSIVDSQWKIKNNDMLWMDFGGSSETFSWDKEGLEKDTWYVDKNSLRIGASIYVRSEENTSKGKKDIETLKDIMHAAEKVAVDPSCDGMDFYFEIQFYDGRCTIEAKSMRTLKTYAKASDMWKDFNGGNAEISFSSSVFITSSDKDASPVYLGLVDNKSGLVTWYASKVYVPFALSKAFSFGD